MAEVSCPRSLARYLKRNQVFKASRHDVASEHYLIIWAEHARTKHVLVTVCGHHGSLRDTHVPRYVWCGGLSYAFRDFPAYPPSLHLPLFASRILYVLSHTVSSVA